jgi:hypothetical protein
MMLGNRSKSFAGISRKEKQYRNYAGRFQQNHRKRNRFEFCNHRQTSEVGCKNMTLAVLRLTLGALKPKNW